MLEILSVVSFVALNANGNGYTMEHYCTWWVWGSGINTVPEFLCQRVGALRQISMLPLIEII